MDLASQLGYGFFGIACFFALYISIGTYKIKLLCSEFYLTYPFKQCLPLFDKLIIKVFT